jgi:glycosyltransferase involved in cell wall biosynthesis
MRILQINTSDQGGGAAGSVWNLHHAYRARGHEAWLAVGEKHSDAPFVVEIPGDEHRTAWARWLYRLPRQMQSLRVRGGGRISRAVMALAEPGRFWRYIKGTEDFDHPGSRKILELTPEKPQIVHCHNLHGGFFDLRLLPWLSTRMPVLINLRDAWLFTGHCAYFIDCHRWRIGCGQCPRLNVYPALRADGTALNWRRKRDIYRRSHFYVTAPSRWLINQAKDSMLGGIEYRVIPNGIDLSIFSPGDRARARAELGLPVEARIILTAAYRARRNPYKDYKTIEKAVSLLGRERPAGRFLFICLGSRGKPRKLGAVEVRFTDFIQEPSTVARYYRAADVFIHAAKAEAFGKTVVEALACGTPVVATAVGGIPELFEDGSPGFLTPAGDAEMMAGRIVQILKNDDLRQSMSRRAVLSARRFDLNCQADSFLAWYREIVDKHAAPQREKSL